MADDNPFETLGLDPRLDPAALTDALRERVEQAVSDEEEAALRDAWRTLTQDPRQRLRLALRTQIAAGPSARPPVPRNGAPALSLRDLAPLGDAREGLAPLPARPLEEDPILNGGNHES